MHIHILGICGTFMGGLAALAREAGHRVTGCDAGVYPPMSDQLEALGIDLKVVHHAQQDILALYEVPLALIRPDQIVAWRGKNAIEATQILKQASGA